MDNYTDLIERITNMDDQQRLDMLLTMMPSPTYLFGAIVFGILGFAAYRYGKKTERPRIKWGGVALMFYPYLIGSNTFLLLMIGLALCIVIYLYKDE